ncbi:hypothetical protein D6764_04580 [Candidatus Woesearchaeota archaeon]|nr:MAG: hypothetical protein D6764_04580 [Candidatus Woesearchaeota archaeon]
MRAEVREHQTRKGPVLEVSMHEKSCLFRNEEHAQIYALLLEVLAEIRARQEGSLPSRER